MADLQWLPIGHRAPAHELTKLTDEQCEILKRTVRNITAYCLAPTHHGKMSTASYGACTCFMFMNAMPVHHAGRDTLQH
jgi:hypothetical protein